MSKSFAIVALSLAPAAYAHGFVSGIVSGGQWYSGWNPSYSYQNPVPSVAGWSAQNLDNGFVAPSSFGAADIVCHKSSTPGKAYVPVKAGDTIDLQWNTWPESHVGPIIDYIASCGSDCTTADKTSLSFVKYNAGAWKSGYSPGKWVTDDLISSNFTWKTTIPSNLKAGLYVLRHEIIALHSAGQSGGAQAYPQCINLNVTGSGSTAISGGVPATSFYKESDKGILFDVYSQFSSYPIPGPALWSAATQKLRRYISADWEARQA